MDLQNGYKVIYEDAKDGKRTLFASESNRYPTEEDFEIASFAKKDFEGKTIYEHKGKFYVSKKAVPSYENGVSTDTELFSAEQLAELFVAKQQEEANIPAPANVVEPAADPDEEALEDNTEATEPEVTEPETDVE